MNSSVQTLTKKYLIQGYKYAIITYDVWNTCRSCYDSESMEWVMFWKCSLNI